MSVDVALANIRLEPSPRWGHTQYSLEYHEDFLHRHTRAGREDPQRPRLAYDRFEFDFLWNTQDGVVDWGAAGRTTDIYWVRQK